jgi:hypothetical protein
MTPRVRAILENHWHAGKLAEGWVWAARTKSGHVEPSTLKKQRAKTFRTIKQKTRLVGSITELKFIGRGWYKFAFRVRGVEIRDCRWSSDYGCVQLPISYNLNPEYSGYGPTPYRRVVHARGALVKRLLAALQEQAPKILEAEASLVDF